MIEAGVIIDLDGEPLHWHLPAGRTSASIPDSRELWDVLWTNRERIAGFAHTHPGSGIPAPSHEDVTTFSAVELALGRRLDWWIASADRLAVVRWRGPDNYDYGTEPLEVDPSWATELRRLSK
jgi:proteasome lid subunit RPN8/RPN11